MAVDTIFQEQRRAEPTTARHPRASRSVSPLDAHAALVHAVSGLERNAPHFSAHAQLWLRQVIFLGFMVGVTVAVSVAEPSLAWAGLLVGLAVPFACIVVFRTLAILMVLIRPCSGKNGGIATPDSDLPTYSILVPLYDEAHMAPQIVTALSSLDYPAGKLEVLIVLEADDLATRTAFNQFALPRQFRVVPVPKAEPRTKPKALNFALQYARGDYVVVYDAEDLPAAGQLRDAVRMFAETPDDVACLQARLLIHNSQDSWLTRQFSLEYMALFDGLLPAYQTLGVPLPLGGTSNHFPRHRLLQIGGWDPYNVTEDADLGVRLRRLGLRAQMLPSDTWEEAPEGLSGWLPQRTRWLKGWMQTWLVHTRHPIRTLREMKPTAFVGFHMIFGGMVLAALVHPFMYGLLIWQYFTIGPFASPVDTAGAAITGLTAFNLTLGYASAMLLCALSAMRRGQGGLLLTVVTLPVYWLLVSAAAWRAVWQLIVAPFKWEKTRHNMRQ